MSAPPDELVVFASVDNRRAAERMVASLGHKFRKMARKGGTSALVVSGNPDGSLKLTQSRALTAGDLTALVVLELLGRRIKAGGAVAYFFRVVEGEDGSWSCRRGREDFDYHAALEDAIDHTTTIASEYLPSELFLHHLDGRMQASPPSTDRSRVPFATPVMTFRIRVE